MLSLKKLKEKYDPSIPDNTAVTSSVATAGRPPHQHQHHSPTHSDGHIQQSAPVPHHDLRQSRPLVLTQSVSVDNLSNSNAKSSSSSSFSSKNAEEDAGVRRRAGASTGMVTSSSLLPPSSPQLQASPLRISSLLAVEDGRDEGLTNYATDNISSASNSNSGSILYHLDEDYTHPMQTTAQGQGQGQGLGVSGTVSGMVSGSGSVSGGAVNHSYSMCDPDEGHSSSDSEDEVESDPILLEIIAKHNDSINR